MAIPIATGPNDQMANGASKKKVSMISLELFNLSERQGEFLYTIGYITLIISGVAAVLGTIWLMWGDAIKSRYSSLEMQRLKTAAAEATRDAAKANERAVELEEEAAKSKLELARIDPVNLPINTLHADVFLIIKGVPLDARVDLSGMLQKMTSVSLHSDDGALMFMQCTHIEKLRFDEREKAEPGKVAWAITARFDWPSGEFFEAGRDPSEIKFWVEREHATVAMLDSKMRRAVLGLHVLRGEAEIKQGSFLLTINGSQRRKFDFPKASPSPLIIDCPLSKP